MGFFREVFSEDGQGSASRVMMGLHALVGSAAFLYLVHKNHAVPENLGLVTAFVVAPYALNKASDIAAALRGGSKPA
jgi:hypothetical protein